MRHCILPVSAMILSRGKFLVADLAPGDRVQGFDYRSKRLAMATITSVTPVAITQKVLLPITKYKMIPVTKETVGLTSYGIEQPIVNSRFAIGFCQQRLNLIVRELGFPVEFDEMIEAVELQWEWPDYIWFEGILVGSQL